MNTPALKRYMGLALLAPLAWSALPAMASTTVSTEATSDTFLTNDTRYINSNMSSYGAMMISAPLTDTVQGISQARTMETLVAYNTASAKASFDATYGVGMWEVTDVKVKFYTNFDIIGVPANNNQFNVPAAGAFNLAYFANDSWFNPATAGATGLSNSNLTWNSVYGGGTYTGLFTGEQNLGTYTYTGGTTNGTTDCYSVPDSCSPRYWDLSLSSGLLTDIGNGGYVSIHGTAADDKVTYLINQMTKPGAHPQIYITADAIPAVPEPATWLMSIVGVLSIRLLGGKVRTGQAKAKAAQA